MIANNLEYADELRITRLIIAKEYGYNSEEILDWPFYQYLNLKHDHAYIQKQIELAYKDNKRN